MTDIRSHHDLLVWNKGLDLAVLIYDLVRGFPSSERYGLTSQITRSAASVPANIAEGNARGSVKEYAQFVSIAKGSLMETETYIFLAVRIGLVTQEAVTAILSLITELSKMLTALRTRLLQRPT